MFEITKTYPCHNTRSHTQVVRLAASIAVIFLFLPVSIVQAEQFSNEVIEESLLVPPIIHTEAHQVTINFIDSTLPMLLKADVGLAERLGLRAPKSLKSPQVSEIALDAPLPILVIHLKQMRDFVRGKSDPVDLVNNDFNWIAGPGGKLAPARLLFPMKVNDDLGSGRPASWSSIIVERTPSTPWRVYQVGAPTLTSTVKKHAAKTKKPHFLVWIPGANRHYLGHVGQDDGGKRTIKLTVLFDDPITETRAGTEVDPRDHDLIKKLQNLDKDLQLQKKTRPQVGQGAGTAN